MKKLEGYLENIPTRPQDEKENDRESVKYSLIMHSLCKQYEITEPLERHIFSILENMTRRNQYCLYKLEQLAEYSGGSESDIAATLEKLKRNTVIESGFVKKTPGWRLTAGVRKSANFIKGKIDRYGKDPKRS